ncbi:hypothetical protein [Caldalkalibacillus salinus]|uniref:hypothetical protein n=1 Tax=Caldalkalibacillus salinus TaxID=2803787 RepID=UPI001922088E|nr:hypothetical protein [Caldalkalibacillus salinus]
MTKFTFELIHSDIEKFEEIDHVIPASSLEDAIQKFVRKHDLEPPAYYDAPTFDKEIELYFNSERGKVQYKIMW